MSPPSGPISVSTPFVFTHHGLLSGALRGVKFRLVSKTGTVPLVIKTKTAQQVVLRPARPLTPETTYRLVITGVPKRVPRAEQEMTWTTGKVPDTQPPRWVEAPRVLETVWEGYCPSLQGVTVALQTTEPDSQIAFVVDVAPAKGGKGERFIFTQAEPRRRGSAVPEAAESITTRLFVGNACTTPFRALRRGRWYKVTVTAMDVAGNTTTAEPVLFLTPPPPPGEVSSLGTLRKASKTSGNP